VTGPASPALDETRRQLAGLIATATSGAVSAAGALAADTSLYDLGVDSLGWLRLIDAIEVTYQREFDVSGIDLRSATVSSLAGQLHPRAG
jgi:acyl carrier protein